MFKGVKKKHKKLKKKTDSLVLAKNFEPPRNQNKNQNNIMFKPVNKNKRNSEEGCFLRFYHQPRTNHGSVEVSRLKR